MSSEDDVLIEFGADTVIVQVGAVRAEARGEDARSVKRAVANQLLYAIAEQPRVREREKAEQDMRRRHDGEAMTRTDRAFLGNASGQFNPYINR